MKNRVFCAIVLLLLVTSAFVTAATDTREVTMEFDRCNTIMERIERLLRRYADAVELLNRNIANHSIASNETISQEAAVLENRLENFRNRYERARGHEDKIRSDLQGISGPTCPSCTESGVKIYCRHGETMLNDIDEYLDKATDLQGKIASESNNPTDPTTKHKTFKQRRHAVDSLYQIITHCSDKAAITLCDQATINISRADSLHRAHETPSALKALDIATTLIKKASERCSGK